MPLRAKPEPAGDLAHQLSSTSARSVGPPGGLYDNELFAEERGEAIVYIPIADVPPSEHFNGM
jgi:hypothetical protein